MISTDALMQQEQAVLDAYGKTHTGSEIAAFVAKRTRGYIVQEISKAVDRAADLDHAKTIVRGFRDF